MTKVLQQGQADGLCGIYSLLNFLNRTDWKAATATDGLWCLLDACRHFDWLTPHTITSGFEDYQLKAILDLQFANYSMPYASFFIRDVARSYQLTSFRELAMRVLRRRGSIIAHHGPRNHWLLIMRDSSGANILDSANSEQPVKRFVARQGSFLLNSGLVLLPKKLPVLEIDL